MIFYPKIYLHDVTEITLDLLKENDIKALILDMDNTLLDYDKNIVAGGKEWIKGVQDAGIKTCIVSNSSHKDKVEMLSKKLGIACYTYFAMKPFKFGVKKAVKILQEKNENIAVVGDQIFTDIIVANRFNMFSILVEPIEEKDVWLTKIKRPFERRIIKKYREREKK